MFISGLGFKSCLSQKDITKSQCCATHRFSEKWIFSKLLSLELQELQTLKFQRRKFFGHWFQNKSPLSHSLVVPEKIPTLGFQKSCSLLELELDAHFYTAIRYWPRLFAGEIWMSSHKWFGCNWGSKLKFSPFGCCKKLCSLLDHFNG